MRVAFVVVVSLAAVAAKCGPNGCGRNMWEYPYKFPYTTTLPPPPASTLPPPRDVNGTVLPPLREDGRCGRHHLTPDGRAAQCTTARHGPRIGPCCSRFGYCGDTPAHCRCAGCTDFRRTRE